MSGDSSSDEEDDDPMPGLQVRKRPDSSSDEDNVEDRGDDSGMTANRNEYLFAESETWEDRGQYVINKSSNIPTPKWKESDTDTNDEEYDGDNDEEPTLRLQGGYEVETVLEEENYGKTIDHDDSRIDDDEKKEEEEEERIE